VVHIEVARQSRTAAAIFFSQIVLVRLTDKSGMLPPSDADEIRKYLHLGKRNIFLPKDESQKL
jgi:hypothetical protein